MRLLSRSSNRKDAHTALLPQYIRGRRIRVILYDAPAQRVLPQHQHHAGLRPLHDGHAPREADVHQGKPSAILWCLSTQTVIMLKNITGWDQAVKGQPGILLRRLYATSMMRDCDHCTMVTYHGKVKPSAILWCLSTQKVLIKLRSNYVEEYTRLGPGFQRLGPSFQRLGPGFQRPALVYFNLITPEKLMFTKVNPSVILLYPDTQKVIVEEYMVYFNQAVILHGSISPRRLSRWTVTTARWSIWSCTMGSQCH